MAAEPLLNKAGVQGIDILSASTQNLRLNPNKGQGLVVGQKNVFRVGFSYMFFTRNSYCLKGRK